MFGSKTKYFFILTVLGLASARSFISYIERPDFTGKPVTYFFKAKNNDENNAIEIEPKQNGVVLQNNNTDPEDSDDEKFNEIDFSHTWINDDKSHGLKEENVARTESSLPAENHETNCNGSWADNFKNVLQNNATEMTSNNEGKETYKLKNISIRKEISIAVIKEFELESDETSEEDDEIQNEIIEITGVNWQYQKDILPTHHRNPRAANKCPCANKWGVLLPTFKCPYQKTNQCYTMARVKKKMTEAEKAKKNEKIKQSGCMKCLRFTQFSQGQKKPCPCRPQKPPQKPPPKPEEPPEEEPSSEEDEGDDEEEENDEEEDEEEEDENEDEDDDDDDDDEDEDEDDEDYDDDDEKKRKKRSLNEKHEFSENSNVISAEEAREIGYGQ